jgi:CheY-like chemotaxis protein
LGAKILVVDDSDINREVAQHILRGQGATVATCGSGAEALERLREDPNAFEIVLMDVQMPDMDGNEATRRIRTELKLRTLPIIALTAGALVSERERALQAGMNDFLTKPFKPAALIEILQPSPRKPPVPRYSGADHPKLMQRWRGTCLAITRHSSSRSCRVWRETLVSSLSPSVWNWVMPRLSPT